MNNNQCMRKKLDELRNIARSIIFQSQERKTTNCVMKL